MSDTGLSGSKDTDKMLSLMQYVILAGCVFILVYSLQFVHTASFIRIAAVGILIAGASLFVGFILGFVFCIPRTAKPQEGSGKPSSDSLPKPEKDSRPAGVETNTNLVDISDWLTKILVGVGLVELNKIPRGLYRLSEFLGPGLRPGEQPEVGSSQAFAVGIVIFFFGAGFMIGTLWTRLHFQSALVEQERHARKIAEQERDAAQEMQAVAEREKAVAEREKAAAEREKAVAKQDELAYSETTTAEGLFREGDLPGAMRGVERALVANPQNPLALFLKARILKKMALADGKIDRALLYAALETVTKAVEIAPEKAGPVYNMACYQALLGVDRAEVLKNLEKAFKMKPNLRRVAPSDPDLVSLYDDPQFKKLVGSEPAGD